MGQQSIVITLEKREVFVPEQVFFRTVFMMKNELSLAEDLAASNDRFLRFLTEKKWAYESTKQANMNIDDSYYTCPSYLIDLNHSDYLQLEAYRDKNPELSGTVDRSVFSQRDKDIFWHQVVDEAKRQASEEAKAQKLVLDGTFEWEDLSDSQKRGWVIYPPLSARIDHFRQPMWGQFRFRFAVH